MVLRPNTAGTSFLSLDFHITFTEPVEGTTFKAGDAMILRWVNQNLPTVDTPTAKIDIFESTFGTDPYLTNVEPDAELHYEALQYNVPMDIDSKKGSKYYLVLEAGPVRVSSATFFIEPSPETEAARAEAAKNAGEFDCQEHLSFVGRHGTGTETWLRNSSSPADGDPDLAHFGPTNRTRQNHRLGHLDRHQYPRRLHRQSRALGIHLGTRPVGGCFS